MVRGQSRQKTEYNKQREKVSAWFITLNAHESANGMSQEDLQATMDQYEDVVRDFFDQNWPELIYFVNDQSENDKITSVENRITVEVQPFHKAKQIHTHNVLTIKHTGSSLRLDYESTKNGLKEEVLNNCQGANKPVVRIRLSSSKGNNEKEYMEKDSRDVWAGDEVREHFQERRKQGDQWDNNKNKVFIVTEVPKN